MNHLVSTTPNDIPATADIIIIGGGPIGTATLWAIEQLAPGTRTVLIEKSDRLGAGSSLASLECFRSCWPALPLARQMQRSIEVFQNADDYLGDGAAGSLAVKQHGYLFCAFTPAQADTLKADVGQRLHSHRPDAHRISRQRGSRLSLRLAGRPGHRRQVRPASRAGSIPMR